MKALVSLGSLVLAMIPAVALAQQPEACQRVEFSAAVLERFPNIRTACLDVITKDGQTFAVVRANLMRVTPRRMTVRVQLPDDQSEGRRALRCSASVVWASFEMPAGQLPRYRAGLKLSGAEADALHHFALLHRVPVADQPD